MKNSSKKPIIRTIVYITRDLERALPLVGIKGRFIITNHTPFAVSIASKYSNIILVQNKDILDTAELLSQEITIKFLSSHKNFAVVVFKNTSAIEKICSNYSWPLLNPPAKTSALIEEKISQLSWLDDLKDLMPKYKIVEGKNLRYGGENFIAQFNRAHTGTGTFLIDSKDAAEKIAKKFPNRPIKTTEFISGPVFTANLLIANSKTFFGSLSYQITGLSPFTENSFATIGNDWKIPYKLLNKKLINDCKKIGNKVGDKLIAENWRGLFGIDLILDTKNKKVLLLEINCRQAASVSYESKLSRTKNNLLELHLNALQNIKIKPPKIIKDGAQIILRVKNSLNQKTIEKLENNLINLGLKTISYQNSTPGSDRLRIMSKKGIISDHNTFNKTGILIKNLVEKYG